MKTGYKVIIGCSKLEVAKRIGKLIVDNIPEIVKFRIEKKK